MHIVFILGKIFALLATAITIINKEKPSLSQITDKSKHDQNKLALIVDKKQLITSVKRQKRFNWAFLLGSIAGIIGITYVINRYFVPKYDRAPKALPGTVSNFKTDEGLLSYYTEGSGNPVILIHSINAGASSHEMDTIFNQYTYNNTVYSLDLLGFGLSERPDIKYTPEIYIKQIKEFIQFVKAKHNIKPVVIALSMTTEYIVAIAEKNPDLIDRIILISPTGLERPINKVLYNLNKACFYLFKMPVVGQGLFNALTSKLSLKQYLVHFIFVDPRNLSYLRLQHYYHTTHVNGAINAPAYFISGDLIVNNIFQKYLNLKVPTLIIRGSGIEFYVRYDAVTTLTNDNHCIVDSQIDNGGLLPHIEKPDEFFKFTDKFLNKHF